MSRGAKALPAPSDPQKFPAADTALIGIIDAMVAWSLIDLAEVEASLGSAALAITPKRRVRPTLHGAVLSAFATLTVPTSHGH